jgi:hypothetical protein
VCVKIKWHFALTKSSAIPCVVVVHIVRPGLRMSGSGAGRCEGRSSMAVVPEVVKVVRV